MKNTIQVLVVDDDRSMVKTICDILAIRGYGHVAAFSGEEAIDKLSLNSVDCILMDIKMQGIGGVNALQAIKRVAPQIPAILMSAYATDEQWEQARDQGALAVLTKPIDIQMLLSFLHLIRKQESILIVDDDPAFCLTLQKILETNGYRIRTESHSERVLEHMAEEYSLTVLLDLKLGMHDGLDILNSIRRRYSTKPVVLVTGYGSEMSGVIDKAFQIGAYTCLYKPLEIDRLIGIIEEISDKKLRSFFGAPFDEYNPRPAPEVGDPL